MRRIQSTLAAASLFMIAGVGIAPARAGADPVAHLSWDDCAASGNRTRTFACNTNLGSEALIVSFVPPAGTNAFTGIEARLRFWPPAASLPAWWALSSGGCRFNSLKASPFPSGTSACASPWTSQVFWTVELNAATQELRAVVDLNKGQEHGLDSAIEYHGVRIVLDHAKSWGGGACEGCAMPVGIYLSRLALLLGPPDPTYEYAFPEIQYVNWQCDGTPVLTAGAVTGWSFPNCATPTLSPTWGRIHALYR